MVTGHSTCQTAVNPTEMLRAPCWLLWRLGVCLYVWGHLRVDFAYKRDSTPLGCFQSLYCSWRHVGIVSITSFHVSSLKANGILLSNSTYFLLVFGFLGDSAVLNADIKMSKGSYQICYQKHFVFFMLHLCMQCIWQTNLMK